MGRIAQSDRKETEILQFAFLHTPDGDPVCGVVPFVVGEDEATAKGTCDEVAAFGGGALVRQDTQLPYTAIQAALDGAFPYDSNYWDKGVFIDWDPDDSAAVDKIVATAIKYWNEKPSFASKLSTFLLFMEVNGAVADPDPSSTSFSARNGRLWCTALTSWPDDDEEQRTASKRWCDAFVAELSPFHVTTYLNNAMPENEFEMQKVFSEKTIARLQALKKKHDPTNMFKMGAWQYEANK
jgi:hypothetical protein